MTPLRKILSLPFSILGAILLMVAEVIDGEVIVYNADALIKKLRCSNCGHVGNGLIRQ